MKDLNNIQDLINQRADKKLLEAVTALSKIIYNGENYNLLKEISLNIGTDEKPKNINLAFIFSGDGFAKTIIENNTERYREQEAKLFFEKVESLRDDVDNLLDIVNS